MEKQGFGNIPDMIIVDGGKGQLTSAKEVLRELNLENIALIGLVKDDKHKTKGIISREGNNISASPKLLKVLTNMQEEVHNLAIGYHREKRDKDITKSKLDSIKGIGEEKKKELLREFKTVENISNATIEELSKVKGITERIAKEILNTSEQQNKVQQKRYRKRYRFIVKYQQKNERIF